MHIGIHADTRDVRMSKQIDNTFFHLGQSHVCFVAIVKREGIFFCNSFLRPLTVYQSQGSERNNRSHLVKEDCLLYRSTEGVRMAQLEKKNDGGESPKRCQVKKEKQKQKKKKLSEL